MIEIVEPIYRMDFDKETSILKIAFGAPADNDQIVKEVKSLAENLVNEVSGAVLKINGPASMPVAMVIAHAFAHVTQAVAAWDPKLSKYVVVITHSPEFAVGMKID
jgi:CRISPR-associated protein Csx3